MEELIWEAREVSAAKRTLVLPFEGDEPVRFDVFVRESSAGPSRLKASFLTSVAPGQVVAIQGEFRMEMN